jgi:signal transduction histidine kinase
MNEGFKPFRWQPKSGSSIPAAMRAGFIVVFGLWVTFGYQLVRGLQQIEGNVTATHDSHYRGEQALAKVRTNVLLGSIYLRDALIDAAAGHPQSHTTEVTRLRLEVEDVLRTHLPEVESPEERVHWERLQGELSDFWASREATLNQQPKTPEAATAMLLRDSLLPRRDAVLTVLDQLAEVQSVSNARHEQEAEFLFNQVRARLFAIFFGTLVGALTVASIASRHATLLEGQVLRQRRNEQVNREDLERLSARLVNAQEDERRSLARELHDEVGQGLTAVKMDIGVALRGDIDPRSRTALEEARDLTETTLRGVRDMSQLLHPSVLDDFGLPATLKTYLRNFSHRSGIRAQLTETMDERLASEVELCVYRIVQEALSNVARHSGATACTVALGITGRQLSLRVEDNGRGIGTSTTDTDSHGLGLIGMRERAQALGGSFTIKARAEGGTSLSVSIPLKEPPFGELADATRRAG